MLDFLNKGGPALWVIFALSVILVTVILWKVWHLSRLGVWRRRDVERAIEHIQRTEFERAEELLSKRRHIRARFMSATLSALKDPDLSLLACREECERVGKAALASGQSGLRVIELIASIAPLVGLLGTVLGMIEAFQALQDSGNQADPSALAGGIWEALLTTAAGMAVAIPATISLSWFDSVIARLQGDFSDIATRLMARTNKS